jgi:hypothetical protein
MGLPDAAEKPNARRSIVHLGASYPRCTGMNVEHLAFKYVLHELPLGRLPFRRWRFELWHGSQLHAAGWRMSERDALRALRSHASRVGHEMFGLRAPDEDPRTLGPPLRSGSAVRIHHGAIAFSLAPRQLDEPGVLGLPA